MQSRNYQDLSRGDDDRGTRQGSTDQGDMEEYSNYGMRDDRHRGGQGSWQGNRPYGSQGGDPQQWQGGGLQRGPQGDHQSALHGAMGRQEGDRASPQVTEGHRAGQHPDQQGGYVGQDSASSDRQRSSGYGGYGGASFGAGQGGVQQRSVGQSGLHSYSFEDKQGSERVARSMHPDPDYHQWREQQMHQLDGDYEAWRQERSSKFAEDFGQWRNSRRSAQGSQTSTTVGAIGSDVSNQSPSRASEPMGAPTGSSVRGITSSSPSGTGHSK